MGIDRKRLMTPAVITDSAVTYYTVGANKKTKDIELHFFNADTTNPIGVTVYLVESGGSAAASNTFLHETWFILDPLESRPWGTDQVLNSGDTVQAKAGTTGKISMFLSGTEVS